MKHTTLSDEQCRWARRTVLNLSQQALSREAGVSLSYLKQFETGRFNPSEDFHKRLLAFFESKDVDLAEFGESQVSDPTPSDTVRPRKARRPCFYPAAGLLETDLEMLLDTIENSFERLDAMLSQPVDRNFFGETETSKNTTHDVFSELALIGVTYAAIAGRVSVRPMLIAAPKTQVDYVANFLADARGDIARDDDAGDDEAGESEEAA